jgi:pyridoxal 5'-phosphate synthase pdxS subunit
MATELPSNGATATNGNAESSFTVKTGLARMLKGGVIMDVVDAKQVCIFSPLPSNPPPLSRCPAAVANIRNQARIAEEAGACAVMALERVPADIRAQGGVARMSDPKMIKEIMAAVTIPVMAKARIGHFVECQVRTQSIFAGVLSRKTYTFVSRSSKPLASTTSTNPKS